MSEEFKRRLRSMFDSIGRLLDAVEEALILAAELRKRDPEAAKILLKVIDTTIKDISAILMSWKKFYEALLGKEIEVDEDA